MKQRAPIAIVAADVRRRIRALRQNAECGRPGRSNSRWQGGGSHFQPTLKVKVAAPEDGRTPQLSKPDSENKFPHPWHEILLTSAATKFCKFPD